MLHILGAIGKGIGITLLCIVVILLLLLLALLFVPIRYRVKGLKQDGENAVTASAKVYWLLHVVSFVISWDGKCRSVLRVFGIPIYDSLRKKENKKKTIKKEKKKRKQKQLKARKEETKPAATYEEDAEPAESYREVSKSAESYREVSKPAEKYESVTEELEDSEEQVKKSFLQKLKEFCRKLYEWMQKLLALPSLIKEKFQNIKDKLQGIQDKIEAYRTFIGREDFKRAFALCKKQLFAIWKNIRPKKCAIDARFGFEDPATTGQILSYICMLYPLLGKDMNIQPDFEYQVLEGKLLIKGRITVFVLLKAAWILYFNKDIKRLIHIWKKEEALHVR